MTSRIAVLCEALGFKAEEVALMARWSPARQRAIESGDELLAEEADTLAALLGADIETLADVAISSAPRPLGALLKAQAQSLDASARFALAEATTVAREIQDLRRLIGLATGLGEVGQFASNGDYGHPRNGVPERLAADLRTHLRLGTGPVASVRRQVLDPLGIVLLWAALPREIDALAFASDETGAVIVANPNGAHMLTASGRRVAFAHEVCHLLFDRPEMPRFVQACRIDRGLAGAHRGWFERVEQRARAFALYLLAPANALVACWKGSTGAGAATRVREAMEHFGIGYVAVRSHLANVHCLSMREELHGVPTHVTPLWEEADPGPAASVPQQGWLRSGVLADLAGRAVAGGLIAPRRAAELSRGPVRPPDAWVPDPGALGYATSSMGIEIAESP